jgi:hypothetical protein
MDDRRDEVERIAAPCGLYCGACSILSGVRRGDMAFLDLAALGVAEYLGHPVKAADLRCEGCLSEVRAAPCRECAIRSCAISKGVTRCAECADFPCEVITAFNNDGMPHHGEVLRNIRRQREIGVEKWVAEQEARWQCPSCGEPTDWYAVQCHRCGHPLAPFGSSE